MINRTRKLRQDTQRLLREDYPERKVQLIILPERIATERARLTAIRSATSESMMIRGGGNVRQERDTAIITEIDRLKTELTVARKEVSVIDSILDKLSETERRCVELMDINRQHGAVDRLCNELGYEKTAVYDVYNTALDKIARFYWGR